MERPYAAYFIGGPEDMTKRVITKFLEFIRVPEMPTVPAYIESEEPVKEVEYSTHLYRARCEVRPEGQPYRVVVYEYMGRE